MNKKHPPRRRKQHVFGRAAMFVLCLIFSVLFLLPMHFAASIARTCSPITAVIVVASGMGNVSPFDLIKRTFIPMCGAMIVNIGMTFFYYYRG